ncbi:MAG: hypothetical protein NTZ90_01550 [Proteobacteria bacterium]|nr:hypothetical protein [Pseudomonadota bacterium]
MLRLNRSILLVFGLASLIAACGKGKDKPDKNDNPTNSAGQGTGSGQVDCASTLSAEEWIKKIDSSHYTELPSETDRNCVAAKAPSRLAIPKTLKRINGSSDSITGHDNLVSRNLALWDQLTDKYQSNFSNFIFSALPPYADESGKDLSYPLAAKYLEQKFNVASLILNRERGRGRPVFFVQFYPPTQNFPRYTTAAELKDFINNTYIPEKVKEAKFAELMKVEGYSPFMAEWEVILNGQTSLFCSSGSTCLSQSDQIALSKELLTNMIGAIRPLFTGMINIESSQTYSVSGEFWNQVDFTGFDNISFTLNPKCYKPTDTASLDDQIRSYYSSQLKNFKAIMERHPKASWSIGEFFARPTGFGPCGYSTNESFSQIEDRVYELGIEALKAATWGTFRGVSFDNIYILTDAARTRIAAYLATQ